MANKEDEKIELEDKLYNCPDYTGADQIEQRLNELNNNMAYYEAQEKYKPKSRSRSRSKPI